MKTFILSTLLHYANRDIPYLAKERFYDIKKDILKRYGQIVDTDYQHIKKECYSCDGTGIFHPEYRRSEPCWKCRKGIYEEFVTYLAKYKFGKYYFHTPYHKVYILRDGELPNYKFIEGYITHKAPKYHIGNECALWLLLYYDFKTFKRIIRSSQRLKPRTPLVALQSTIFFFRYKQWNKCFRWLKPKKKAVEPYYPNYFEDDELPF